MSPQADQVLLNALKLCPVKRADLIEKLLASFSFPDRKAIDELWATEAKDRIDTYERGEIKSKTAAEVFVRIANRKSM